MKTDDLGKPFSVFPGENTGFVRGIERVGLTKLKKRREGKYRGIPANIFNLNIGIDYKGEDIPRDAEEIRIYNLSNGRQVIHYLHLAPRFKKDGTFLYLTMKPFLSEFRNKDEKIKIEDIFRNCSLSQ